MQERNLKQIVKNLIKRKFRKYRQFSVELNSVRFRIIKKFLVAET